MGFEALHFYMSQRGLGAYTVAPESESSGYESGIMTCAEGEWRVRTARVTPTKPGAFVAVWRRALSGQTEPFTDADDALGMLVFVEEQAHRGVFMFPKSALVGLGILATSGAKGKRGFRLYPPWCTDLNPQARRTQNAQAPYFESY